MDTACFSRYHYIGVFYPKGVFDMNIAIVDDRKEERNALKSLLLEYTSANSIEISLHEFPSGKDFLAEYAPFDYTVIFLDIYMDNMTGMETAEEIRKTDTDTPIIFLTTSREHMGDAFSIHAFDYIEKPADRERLFKCMDDLLKTKTALHSETLDFSRERTSCRLPFPDIVSVRTAESNYLDITDKKGDVHHTRMTFSAVCERLGSDSRFLTVNRGILINMDYIVRFEDGVCILKDGREYRVFTKKIKETEQKWQNYIFNRIRGRQKERGRRNGRC